jgi:hypothetical protein
MDHQDDETPAHQHHAMPQEAVTLRTVFNMVRSVKEEMSEIKGQLATGAANMRNLSAITEKIDPIQDRLIRAEETISTLRLLVYSAVGVMLLGLLGTVGTAVVWVLANSNGRLP